MNRLFCFFVVVAVVLVSGQVYDEVVPGPCSRFQVISQQPFTPKSLVGTWYVYTVNDYADIAGVDCLSMKYVLNKSNASISATEFGQNLATNERKVFRFKYYFTQPHVGFYKLDSTADDAFKVQIPVADFKSLYIEFNCVDLPDGQATRYFGAYTRLPIPLPSVVGQIENYISAHGFNRTRLRNINHDLLRC